jgi:hypothetical protein
MPMGKVAVEGEVNVRANRKSFHDRMNVKSEAVTSPGLLRGRITFQKASIGEHPSIRAASSMSTGILSNIPNMSQAVKVAS